MKLCTIIFAAVVACVAANVVERHPLVPAYQPQQQEQGNTGYAVVNPNQEITGRQKRSLLLGLGAAGALGLGALGVAGLVGAKAGLIGGVIASKALSGRSYGGGWGHGGGYGGYYGGGYGGYYGGGYGGGYGHGGYRSYRYPTTYYVSDPWY